MLLGQRRFLVHAVLIFVVAFGLGLGDLLTEGPQQARPKQDTRPAAPRRSGDDAGFSIALTQPTDPFLVGRQTIGVEATVPPGDRILQVDFFVDGRLVDTDRQAPYGSTFDFGTDIRRHTVVVSALTSGGRRAKVSFVSRAAQIGGDPDRPLTVIPVVVRDAAGRLVHDLSVSDFTLLEKGQRQTILHFDREPAPLSIGMVLHVPEQVAAARGPLLRQAAVLADDLPSYHALAFLEAPRADLPAAGSAATARIAQASLIASPSPARQPSAPSIPALEFTYDRTLFMQRLAESAGVRQASLPRPSLAAAITGATEALATRPRGRVLLALVAGAPASGDCPVLAAERPGPPGGDSPGAEHGCSPEDDGDCPPDETSLSSARARDGAPVDDLPDTEGTPEETGPVDEALAAALEGLRKAGVTLHVLALGSARGGVFEPLRLTAEETGGEFLVARSQPGVEAFSRLLSETLTNQYLLSYSPTDPERPGWRALEVRLRQPDLVLRSRKSLYTEAPVEPTPAVTRPAARRPAPAVQPAAEPSEPPLEATGAADTPEP